MGVFADAEADQQQGNQLGDDHHRENLQSNRLFQVSAVREHFGHDAQTGHGQHAGQRQRLGKIQFQSEIENQIGGDQHRNA